MVRRCALAAGLWMLLGATALAQDAITPVQPKDGVNVLLEPLNSGGALNPPALFSTDPIGIPSARAVKVDIGFEYLQPYYTSRSTLLAVPAPNGGSALGPVHNYSTDFGFVPQVSVDYQFSDLGFGVGASGKLLHLSGHLERNVSSTTATGNLNAQTTVDLAVANLIEGFKTIDLDDCPCFQNTCLQDVELTFTIGARYVYAHQDFTSNLTLGNNVGTLSATQSYSGYGLTSAFNTLFPVSENLALYSNLRGSVVLGTDDRTSQVSVVSPDNPTRSVASTATENRTVIIPVGEAEVGVAYGLNLAKDHTAAAAPSTAPLLWFRVGVVGQVWGNIGLLNINDGSGNQFSDSHLFLYGATLQVGLDY